MTLKVLVITSNKPRMKYYEPSLPVSIAPVCVSVHPHKSGLTDGCPAAAVLSDCGSLVPSCLPLFTLTPAVCELQMFDVMTAREIEIGD